MRDKGVGILATVLFVVVSPVTAVIDYNDGGIYDIATTIDDQLRVDFESPGMGTTLNLLEGGHVATGFGLQCFEDSIINLLGGTIASPGRPVASLYARGRSRVTVSAGEIQDRLWGYDNSQISVLGGSIGTVEPYDSSQVIVSGGSIHRLAFRGSSQSAVSGGIIGDHLDAGDNCRVVVSGGSIADYIWAFESSRITLSGGSIGGDLMVTNEAVLTIDGSDFAIDGVPVGYTELVSIVGSYYWKEPQRRITGTLFNGDTLDSIFYIGDTAKIVLLPKVDCPSADHSGDCFVDFNDFAVLAGQWPMTDYNDVTAVANQWLTDLVPNDPCHLVWVDINDPGVPGHEGFVGQMSKYETTNGQYCMFLNSALLSGDIYVMNNRVYGADGSNGGDDFVDEVYMDLRYEKWRHCPITFSGAAFSVRRRNGYSMVDHPVTEVSWYGAAAFCNYYGYRLPTEWEWQAVADYDGSYAYGCGTTIDLTKANYFGGRYPNPVGLSNYPYTNPVNYYPSFGYGMNDMAGGVYEWTSSWYPDSETARIQRGGSWTSSGDRCTVSHRPGCLMKNLDYHYGFRVCR